MKTKLFHPHFEHCALQHADCRRHFVHRPGLRPGCLCAAGPRTGHNEYSDDYTTDDRRACRCKSDPKLDGALLKAISSGNVEEAMAALAAGANPMPRAKTA
jgi:hypothetical protein